MKGKTGKDGWTHDAKNKSRGTGEAIRNGLPRRQQGRLKPLGSNNTWGKNGEKKPAKEGGAKPSRIQEGLKKKQGGGGSQRGGTNNV